MANCLNFRLSFLHVCGGVSEAKTVNALTQAFSPRMWRCFLQKAIPSDPHSVFSTYVEVFLCSDSSMVKSHRFLHVCGGVSIDSQLQTAGSSFSPRMWRCFPKRKLKSFRYPVFSTYVEVFPQWFLRRQTSPGFLHVCGGVSVNIKDAENLVEFSPRMWRCFCLLVKWKDRRKVFSTYVEVFP